MKFSAILLASLMSSSAFAAVEIPNCWEESGTSINDGEFQVGLDTAAMTKADVVRALGLANGRNINAQGYPLVLDDKIFLYTKAVDLGMQKMPREELKKLVNAELTALAEIPGVSIGCSYISYPAQPAR